MTHERVDLEVQGQHLSLSNLDKVLFPTDNFTKGELIDFYVRVAPVMLSHIEHRALTLRRFPNGVEGKSFFEKHVPSHAPPFVQTIHVPSTKRTRSAKDDDEVEYVVINDLPSLIWAANLATIEFHVPLWRVGNDHGPPGEPDHLVFDLDPGPGTSIVECCRIGQWIAQRLGDEHLDAMAKTSGSKGLQVYAPLSDNRSWDAPRAQALEFARAVERDHPELVVTNMRKDLRENRVLIDWSQNHPAKTTVAAYSVRARSKPTVSTPVTWDEVERCERTGEHAQLQFLPRDVLSRVERDGDLFADLNR